MTRSHQREGRVWQKKNTPTKVPKTLRNIVAISQANEPCEEQIEKITSETIIKKFKPIPDSSSWMNYIIFGVSNLEDSWGSPFASFDLIMPKNVQYKPLANSWEELAD